MKEFDMEGFDQKEYRTVVLAALLHDVGKLFEMGGLIDDYQKADTILQGDHPNDRKKLYYKQVHVLHTKDFCEVLAKQIPSLLYDPVTDIKKPGHDWINIAFRHHIASTPLEKMIQKADQLSTSEQEQEDFCDTTVSKKNWLEPVIERISLFKNVKTEPQYAFEIRALALEKDCLFPKLIKEIEPQIGTHKDTKQIPIDNKNYLGDPKAGYLRLGNEMLKEISHLPNNLSFYSLMETILALFEKYLSCVPALINVKHQDISLYDHLRTTAAIVDGLYRYASEKENLVEEPWILICGDFSGIQKFIYRITSKRAAKSIRGRSLFVQLLCDAATDYILKRIDGLPTSKIYSSGGKFYLLVSSTCRQGICDAVEFINDYLLSAFGGDVFLGLGIAPVTAKHFEQGEMSEQWKAANIDLMRNRKQRFAAQMKKQKDFFDPPSAFGSAQGCQVCGRGDISVIEDKDNKRRICKMCKQLEELGGHLKDVKYFLWSFNVNISKALRLKLSRKSDLDLLGIQLFLLKNLDELNGFDSLSDCRIERINSTDFIHSLGAGSTFRFLGHWDPDKLSGDWEFDDFANNSVGINRLGILRMDVDNLGQVFIKGLQFPDISKKNSSSVKEESDETIMRKPMASISRVATLSRQLDIFFSGYLIKLLRKYERCQIIYAGGDDLFIIGSWDELPEVAKTIRAAFQAFCCKNPDMTISGGIALTGGKYPISRGADHAGAAEELAKNCKHRNKEKDAFCFLDESLSWKDFITAGCLKDLFQSIVADKNKGFLNRLRNIVLVNKAFEREKRRKGMKMEEIQKLLFCDKWRWQIAYSLKRYVTQGEGIEEKVDAVRHALFKNVVNGSETDMSVIHWLGLPTRWTEFLERKEEN